MADGLVRVGAAGKAGGAGATPPYTQDTLGNLVFTDWQSNLAMRGLVFNISNATKGTVLTVATTSYVDTTPVLLVDVPSGKTMIPIELILNQGGTVAGGVVTVISGVDNKVRYSSGGTALTIRNSRLDDLVGTGAVAYSGATANAVGREMGLFTELLSFDVIHAITTAGKTSLTWRASVPRFLVGPASWLVYTFAATTNASWHFYMSWAELDSAAITQS